MKPESEQLEDYLYSLDFETQRKPYEKQKRDKIRDEIRQQILTLKQQENARNAHHKGKR